MKLIKATDYSDMSKRAAELILKQIKQTNQLTLGLATGSTPIKTYQHMIRDHQQNQTSYQHVTTFNLDEYVGIDPEDPNSYHQYMQSNLFNHIDIPIEQTHIPDGQATNPVEECIDYEKKLHDHGGIDIQILGLGGNGHIGFNEPGTSFDTLTHVIELTPATRTANARFFNRLAEVPTQAITMGISTILESKQIFLLVSGKEKSDALRKLLENEETDTSFPASALHKHPNVTIIADQEALQYATSN